MYSRVLALIESATLRFKAAGHAVRVASGDDAVLRIEHVADAPYIDAGLSLSSVSDNLRGDLKRNFEDMTFKTVEDDLTSKIDATVATGYMPHTPHRQLIESFQPNLIVRRTRKLSDLNYLIFRSASTPFDQKCQMRRVGHQRSLSL